MGLAGLPAAATACVTLSRKRATLDCNSGLDDLDGGDSSSGMASKAAWAVAARCIRLYCWQGCVEAEKEEGRVGGGAELESGAGNTGRQRAIFIASVVYVLVAEVRRKG